jgi:ABC-type Mn2+/Zn2+ transport system permease subunit
MLGDAISHSVLPGLAGAFLLTGTRDPWAMLLGAVLVGLITAFLSSWLTRFGRVPEDAALGVVFTSMFAIGVLLISRAAGRVDLDPGCVLYGMLEGVAFDRVSVAGASLPRAFVVMVVALLVNTGLVVALFKEFKLASFDSALAGSMGFSAALLHLLLMAMSAGTSVAAFEAVGSIMVVALLVVPGATTLLLTTSLSRMIPIACCVGAAAGVLGTIAAVALDTSVPGAICVVLGLEFAAAMILSPSTGLVSRAWNRASLRLRIRREDILGALARRAEGGQSRSLGGLTGGAWGVLARRQLLARGLIVAEASGEGGIALSERGATEGRRILAAHRLWESYLARNLGLPVDHLHDPAERWEHFVTHDLERQLREGAGDSDPQGKPIPPSE